MGFDSGARKKSPRELLRAAVLAATTATTACAVDTPAPKEPPQLLNVGILLRQSALSAQDITIQRALLADMLASRRKPTGEQLQDFERFIAVGVFSLPETLRFFERGFASGGWYKDMFSDAGLTHERLSLLLRAVDHVSARLNRDYALRDQAPTEVPLFKEIPLIKRATTNPVEGSRFFCNAFLSRNFVGEVFEDTASHCGIPDLQARGFFVSHDGTDAASRQVGADELSARGIKPDTRLPVTIRNMPPEALLGQVVVSYSVSPRGDEKVHFSIAMPLTDSIRGLLFDSKARKLSGIIGPAFFMLKPIEESRVIGLDEAGKKIIEAQGSSGSGLFMSMGTTVVRIGSYTTQAVISDPCRGLCFGIATFNMPQVHDATQDRASAMTNWRAIVRNSTPQSEPTSGISRGRRGEARRAAKR